MHLGASVTTEKAQMHVSDTSHFTRLSKNYSVQSKRVLEHPAEEICSLERGNKKRLVRIT
jgi:hypothetical protein